jgi:IclR family pca regulon transcriptional regulator
VGAAPDPDFMLSLARGLAVIRAFDLGQPRMTVSEVARLAGISRAAARRCLHTLAELGYALRAGTAFELTPAVLSLGSTYLGSNPIARLAQPVLERIASRLHESSSLAVLDADEIVYVARASTQRILSIAISVGTRLPADCTSMGRAILAFTAERARARFLSTVRLKPHTPHTIIDRRQLAAELGRVRQQGYALVDQELELGLRSLAVPVLGPDGHALAAVNVGVHVARSDKPALIREVLPVLRQEAEALAAAAREYRTTGALFGLDDVRLP